MVRLRDSSPHVKLVLDHGFGPTPVPQSSRTLPGKGVKTCDEHEKQDGQPEDEEVVSGKVFSGGETLEGTRVGGFV